MKWLLKALVISVILLSPLRATADHTEALHEGDAVRVYQWCETVADLEGLAISTNGEEFGCWQPTSLVGGVLGPVLKTIIDRNGVTISIHEVTNVIVNVAEEGYLFESFTANKVFIAVRREGEGA